MLSLAVMICTIKSKPSPGLFQILLNFDNSLERFTELTGSDDTHPLQYHIQIPEHLNPLALRVVISQICPSQILTQYTDFWGP